MLSYASRMTQSLYKIVTHIVFSTKNRESLLQDNILPELHLYIAGILKNKGCYCYEVGGIDNHIHIACTLPKAMLVSNLIKEIKTSTSTWLKTKNNNFVNFYWQRGYGVFSISPSHLRDLRKYIVNQHEHHKQIDFKDEFIILLKKYEIDYEERYLWN